MGSWWGPLVSCYYSLDEDTRTMQSVTYGNITYKILLVPPVAFGIQEMAQTFRKLEVDCFYSAVRIYYNTKPLDNYGVNYMDLPSYCKYFKGYGVTEAWLSLLFDEEKDQRPQIVALYAPTEAHYLVAMAMVHQGLHYEQALTLLMSMQSFYLSPEQDESLKKEWKSLNKKRSCTIL